MDIIVNLLKYIFVLGVAIEVALILRALYTLARDKAREAEPPAAPTES